MNRLEHYESDLLFYFDGKPLELSLYQQLFAAMEQAFPDASVKVQDNVAMLVGMVVFTGLNYIGQRFFAFAKKGEKPLDKEGKS